MHEPLPLGFSEFGTEGDPLVSLENEQSRQVSYLRCYLHDLGARSVVLEPRYFDRDYLSEFEAFYARSSAAYPNICRRAHYFACSVTAELLARALDGEVAARSLLEDAYLGHVVLRPIPAAPIGRTVLRLYPDPPERQATPRVMQPAREYVSHVAGLELKVSGLAWQQQDTAVGSCATVALWSMLHSSVFNDNHPLPTTAAITALAHSSSPVGRRAFPDSGLQSQQILGVIKGHMLAPLEIGGDLDGGGFSRERFCSLIALFLRSGYPVLVSGALGQDSELHTVCVVGFRSPALPSVDHGKVALADENLSVLYLHDDNLGPAARFEVNAELEHALLEPRSPPPRNGAWPAINPTTTYHELEPRELIVAVHQDVRTDPLELQQAALRYSKWLPDAFAHEVRRETSPPATGMLVSSRFVRLPDYVGGELASVLREQPSGVLARARLALWQEVPPMSFTLGLVRVTLGTEPMMDLLFDTSDSDRHLRPSAYVAFHSQVPWLLARWQQTSGKVIELGRMVAAWTDPPRALTPGLAAPAARSRCGATPCPPASPRRTTARWRPPTRPRPARAPGRSRLCPSRPRRWPRPGAGSDRDRDAWGCGTSRRTTATSAGCAPDGRRGRRPPRRLP